MEEKKWVYLVLADDVKVKIDEEDFERVNAHKWRITRGTTGRRRVVTSVRSARGSRQVTLGKFLMNPPAGMQVYPRRFNDGLDYRKSNLIVCTMSERQRLLPKNRVASSSAFRGVSYSTSEKKWRAGIEYEGRSINLGSFDTEAEAALAYNQAALKYFGPMAYQNRLEPKKNRNSG